MSYELSMREFMGNYGKELKVPEGWKISFVKDLFFDGRGRVISEEEIKNNEGEFPVYSSQTANNGELGRINTFDFEGEYITWTTDGANAGTVFYRKGRFNCTNVCGTLRAKKPTVHTKFFTYLLYKVAKKYVSYIGNPKLMNNVFREIELIHPINYYEQQRIAEILETVDNAIEKTDQIIEKYKRIKKGLMQDLLTKGIDENGQIRNEKTHKFKDSPLGKIPEEWDVVKLGEIVFSYAGGTPNREKNEFYGGVIKWLKSGEINKKYIYETEETITTEGFTFSNAKYIEPNTVVIALYGATAGQVSIVKELMTANQAVLALKITEDSLLNYEFLYYMLFKEILSFLSKLQGSGQPNLSKDIIDSLQILLPPLPEQQRIAEILSQIDEAIEKETAYKEKLKRLKLGLMEDLLTGKVRVNHLIKEKN